jgi:hypothetical protein
MIQYIYECIGGGNNETQSFSTFLYGAIGQSHFDILTDKLQYQTLDVNQNKRKSLNAKDTKSP